MRERERERARERERIRRRRSGQGEATIGVKEDCWLLVASSAMTSPMVRVIAIMGMMVWRMKERKRKAMFLKIIPD